MRPAERVGGLARVSFRAMNEAPVRRRRRRTRRWRYEKKVTKGTQRGSGMMRDSPEESFSRRSGGWRLVSDDYESMVLTDARTNGAGLLFCGFVQRCSEPSHQWSLIRRRSGRCLTQVSAESPGAQVF